MMHDAPWRQQCQRRYETRRTARYVKVRPQEQKGLSRADAVLASDEPVGDLPCVELLR